MPILIDGNNLLGALAEVHEALGRLGLCQLLGGLIAAGQTVEVVFDGPAPQAGLARQIAETGIITAYSAGEPADELIGRRIADSSAPRRLTVVSSDRQIRQAARRRRCHGIRSEDFARQLLRMRHSPPPKPPAEPTEKRTGLSPAHRRQWLAEFGLDEDA